MPANTHANAKADFDQRYQTHLKHLKLQGLQPKTIQAYAHAIRRMGEYFDFQIDSLSPEQLTNDFSDLIDSHSWSSVKLDLYGYKFYTLHVLRKPWEMPHFIRPPKAQRLPDIVTTAEAQQHFASARVASYRVFFFTLYSLGLRTSAPKPAATRQAPQGGQRSLGAAWRFLVSEGLALTVADIDASRHRVQVRDSKGNRDRFVPLPDITLQVLRQFWATHRNRALLFPNRAGGLQQAYKATTPLDRGGVQSTLRVVAQQIGLKKRSLHTA